ncbi:MAG: protocatechuate 3,4-dioxygenase [Gammaproteobacteria bacterium]|nr:protocatechuate 3,4-dioxygenase [Gammaproteobacteria bacterium]MDH3411465.1 protocatechuate 3,4-dioxygenase [Gammaproteobacteria bacterium]
MQSSGRKSSSIGRRRALTALALGVSGLVGAKGAAAALLATPAQTRGPFYPMELPLDSDNDLVRVKGRSALAKGEITDLRGRVLDPDGRAVPGARVEIWQCDAFGRYHHPWDRRHAPLDENFQGYGSFTTSRQGAYRFRTIRPVPYPGRAPHIHFAVSAPGAEPFITQMYVAGAPENPRDYLLNRVGDERLRARLIVDFTPAGGNPPALEARFDIVLGESVGSG